MRLSERRKEERLREQFVALDTRQEIMPLPSGTDRSKLGEEVREIIDRYGKNRFVILHCHTELYVGRISKGASS